MGICASSDLSAEEQARRQKEKSQNQEISRRIADEHNADQQVNKLLLLGAGESGKSTLFKQMITIYGTGYPESERKTFIPIISSNILASMKVLCQQSDVYAPITDPDLLAAKNFVENELKGEEEIDSKIGEYLIMLWRSPNIQTTFEHRSQYQLTDSTSYFMERLEDVSSPDYLPTQQDVLRSRVRTTGIVENEFTIDGNQFKMFDVGGQRNERKKWIHCFENVTAVLFVAAISEYDQVLYEDENTNRITEALNLFEEISNSRWFRETSIILFLNKRDLFEIKIAKVPLSQFFPDYHGDNSYESCCEFMRSLFESKNRNQDKQIYTHITCATDTENISMVFNAVKDIVIRKSLNEAGLV